MMKISTPITIKVIKMKNLLLTILLLSGISATAFAQRGKLNSAKSEYDNYSAMLQLQQTEDALESLNEARELIEETLEHDKTKDLPETHLYRSLINAAVANDSTLQADGKTEGTVEIAHESLQRAKELNENVDKRRDELNDEDLEMANENLYIASYNKGINAFNGEDYENALKYFKVATEANPTDTNLYLNTGVVAERLGDTTLAMESYQKLVELEYDDPAIYAVLANMYFNADQDENALEVLETGQERYPDDKDLMITELNYYLTSGRAEEVVGKLEKAVEADPENKNLWFSLGVTREGMEQMDEAEEAYRKALEIDPNYYDANINMGVISIADANEIVKEADQIPQEEEEKYNAKIDEYQDALRGALEYLERAYNTQAGKKDRNLLSTMSEIYTKLNEEEKAAEVKQQLEQL